MYGNRKKCSLHSRKKWKKFADEVQAEKKRLNNIIEKGQTTEISINHVAGSIRALEWVENKMPFEEVT
jgi:hypothetical protein